MTRRFLMTAALALVLSTALTGCGRKGALEKPLDADPQYPRKYPAPEQPDGKPQAERGTDAPRDLSRNG